MLRLTLKQELRVPLEAEAISPDRLCGLSESKVGEQTVQYGRRRRKLRDFFDIEAGVQVDELVTGEFGSTASDEQTVGVVGDLTRVKRLGEGMSQGMLRIVGAAGMHLGAQMRGGLIRVDGDCGAWAGAEMKGGRIYIGGNAGDQLGAAYRGSTTGMRGGLIEVRGAAGVELGRLMRRGTIVVGGVAGECCGLQMRGGTVVLKGGAEIRPGVMMRRGTILSLKPLKVLPTWRKSGDFLSGSRDASFLNFLQRDLECLGVRLPKDFGLLERYRGDATWSGKGEILCPALNTPGDS